MIINLEFSKSENDLIEKASKISFRSKRNFVKASALKEARMIVNDDDSV